MKNKTLVVYSDPGHSWVKVKRSELTRLGIIQNISPYSYQRSGYVYLEEDSDLGHYIDALKENKISYVFKEFSSNRKSRIRSYELFELSDFETTDKWRLFCELLG